MDGSRSFPVSTHNKIMLGWERRTSSKQAYYYWRGARTATRDLTRIITGGTHQETKGKRRVITLLFGTVIIICFLPWVVFWLPFCPLSRLLLLLLTYLSCPPVDPALPDQPPFFYIYLHIPPKNPFTFSLLLPILSTSTIRLYPLRASCR